MGLAYNCVFAKPILTECAGMQTSTRSSGNLLEVANANIFQPVYLVPILLPKATLYYILRYFATILMNLIQTLYMYNKAAFCSPINALPITIFILIW